MYINLRSLNLGGPRRWSYRPIPRFVDEHAYEVNYIGNERKIKILIKKKKSNAILLCVSPALCNGSLKVVFGFRKVK